MRTEAIPLPTTKLLPHQGYLTLLHQNQRKTFEINQGLVVGRDEECGVYVDDHFMSARHFRVERKEDVFTIRDLRSRNGLFVNGTKVVEAILADGDRIQAGQSEFIYKISLGSEKNPLISKNPSWSTQISRLPSVGQSELPVLLLGESGTGKEVLAQLIHRYSARSTGPFISVNCSALSESLIESELFGHIKGSFTGASNDRKGAFESARGGTLFLDEVGDLPLHLQPKLLRALENLEIRPVGSDRTISTDVRIISATHNQLKDKVLAGQFRSDLYYRLNVVQLNPPALRDRMEDFEDLLFQFAKSYRISFSFGAIEEMKKHSWPGNIRELKNTVARAKALYAGHSIEKENVESIIEKLEHPKAVSIADLSVESESDNSSPSLMDEIQKRLIVERLAAHRGNQRRTAEELGIPKSTLFDRLKQYGIDPKTYKSR